MEPAGIGNGQVVTLPRREMAVLEVLWTRRGRVVNKDQLFTAIYRENDGVEFAEVIEGLQVHDPSSAKTYRELVPFEVWHSGTTRVEIEANLAGRIRILLDQLSAGTVDVKELQIESERFDHLAEIFRDLGRELVIRSTDQPETS